MTESAVESPRKLTTKSGYLILLCSSPILIASAIFGKVHLGFGAWICSALVISVARVRWDLRTHIWFWTTIASAELLQIPIVLLIPWNDRGLTWITFLPVAVLDYGLVYGIIKLIEKVTKT